MNREQVSAPETFLPVVFFQLEPIELSGRSLAHFCLETSTPNRLAPLSEPMASYTSDADAVVVEVDLVVPDVLVTLETSNLRGALPQTMRFT